MQISFSATPPCDSPVYYSTVADCVAFSCILRFVAVALGDTAPKLFCTRSPQFVNPVCISRNLGKPIIQ